MNENEVTETTILEIAKTLDNTSMFIGKIVGMEEVVKNLRTESGDAFAAGNDAQAHARRALADSLQLRVDALRQEWKEKYHKQNRDALQLLEMHGREYANLKVDYQV